VATFLIKLSKIPYATLAHGVDPFLDGDTLGVLRETIGTARDWLMLRPEMSWRVSRGNGPSHFRRTAT
jgi:hypothetical protein